jgi:predicted RND superfamily exporter protein
VLLVSVALAGLGSVGFTQLRIDARFEDLYGEDSQVVRWARAAARLLREPETLEISIRPTPGVAPHDPALLRVVAQAEQLADLDGLGPALSILAPMRQLHQLVHHTPLALDDGAQSAERARRMLRLLRFEDPELVSFFVDAETGAHRISIQSAKLAQEDLRALLAEVRRRLDTALPSGWEAHTTGPLAVVATLIDEIRRTQLHSFALAAAFVWVLMALYFRSLWLASVGLLPTALPVLLTLGAMGFAGLALDVGSAMVAAVVLGLAVDDAIHLIGAWRRRRAAGEPAQTAVASALHEVGRALATTSFALATGFLALSLAPWQSIASFGFVAAVAILAALVAVLLVLPALLAWRPGTPR